MADEETTYSYKFILLGDSGVGKTNILSRMVIDDFSIETQATVTMEYGRKMLTIDDKKVKLQIWDTAGQEKYRALTKSYIKGSMGVLLVYDISKKETFDNIETWIQDIKDNGDKDCVIEIIGNKIDLEEERQVSTEEGETKAKNLNSLFIETSALMGMNIEEAFTKIVKKLLSGSESKSTPNSVEKPDDNIGKTISIQPQEQSPNNEEQPKKKKKRML